MGSYSVMPDKKLRIAISGKSGCGNTTDSALLAKTLGIKLINFTFRQLAQEKGISLAQVIENAKTDDWYDRTVDTRQVELARIDSCVLGSRLAIWMLPEADLKVYLDASDDVRANRILKREGGNLDQIKEFTAMRDREDSARYKKLYGIDNSKYEFADLKIDTADKTPDQIVACIIAELEKRGFIKSSEKE